MNLGLHTLNKNIHQMKIRQQLQELRNQGVILYKAVGRQITRMVRLERSTDEVVGIKKLKVMHAPECLSTS